ncbi:RraA family protein [Brucella intermedia]|uniref:Putative 4-hydroxy-4-methyl-2-oxoglutarate aldolase n=4 Tax=Brucella intermedia TaxID=94625 RepID=A0ABR6AUL0_9HYPH|nr:RraA family protein [Brucella intermedia]ERI15485.1 4-hydroxy-4-methyl-2-oxoglutarate aldolase [Ochrobactrum sp. EGD-AQ16]PJT18640.1 4-hydroxy-4-methyl-2-oxoglutarate aldolase [Ochrobactrum sp. 30A/1000/2015]PJT39222.1 4-hydroxy-4-methyl-2-oxoglutarate aldolase [Ochrobactrum sp. 27A/999/2015]PJT43291.1 4-hydroxy-4-methyl-2-oxoglutarate aldolase [Ochrobactrum sp. 23A/997/2015]HCH72279.1 RraA family protein [Ochrobactrum sp.]
MYTINPMPEQIAESDLKLLSGVETATVGHWRFFGFMHRSIQPLLPKRRVVGTAVTIAIPGPDSTLLHHVTGMLRPGDILVVDRMGDDRYACWGGGVTIAAKAAGAVAGIVDGPCTDLTEIEDSDFPMWARGISPITTRLYDLGGGINIPVSCGGVVVNPGDAILADESGVLVLPRDEVNAVASRALDIQDKGKAREASVKTGLKLGDVSGATRKILAHAEG